MVVQMKNFFRLIRFQNLAMLALMQLLFRFGFFKWQSIPLALADWQYVLLVLATVFIAAGGYVINDIFDQETDSINKPTQKIVGTRISEKNAYNYYVALTTVGVAIGFYLSNVIMKPSFAAVFIFIAATLYFYATSLKQMLLLGNIIVALLLSVSIMIIGVFDLYPATGLDNQKQMRLFFSILTDYAIFAFIINFLREIVKDLEDLDGDAQQQMTTLPIVLGVSKTSKLLFALSIAPLFILLRYINMYLMELLFVVVFLLLFVAGPLLYFTIKMWSAKSKSDFHLLSSVLKWVLFFGILSVAIINFNLKYNA